MDWIIIIMWAIFCPIICSVVAETKGRSVGRWLAAGFFFGIFAVILIIALPANHERLVREEIAKGRKKICPHCAEAIWSEAEVCRYCGRELQAVAEEALKSSSMVTGTDAYRAHAAQQRRRASR